jgi:hypothetical protein
MKKNKMNIAILGYIYIFLIAALLLVPTAQAEGIAVKYKLISQTPRIDVIPVPDMKGHIIGLIEKRGLAIYENGEIATYHTRATIDSTKGKGGSFWGYSDYKFEDGSTIVSKYQGTSWVPSGKKLSSIKGTGEYINGTGRFTGIKGKLSFNGKYITPYTKDETKGDTIVEVTGSYTLPKK